MSLLKSKAIAEMCNLSAWGVRQIFQSETVVVKTKIPQKDLLSIKKVLEEEFSNQLLKLNTLIDLKSTIGQEEHSEWLVVYKDGEGITHSDRVKAKNINEAIETAKNLMLQKNASSVELKRSIELKNKK